MGKTRIPYANESWSVVTGCPPDEHNAICRERCWAAATAWRFPQTHGGWKDCPACRDFRESRPGCNLCKPVPFSRLVLHEDRLTDPLHWRKPRVVFVAPMGDLFHEEVPQSFLCDVFGALMVAACSHIFLVLTKRAERMRQFWTGVVKHTELRPPQNLWLGVTVWDQESADASIPLLLDTPAAHRWLSAEPMLGPVDLRPYLFHLKHLDWVIVGCESGPPRRPCPPSWLVSVQDQCRNAAVPCYVKQYVYECDGVGKVLPIQPGREGLPSELAEVLLAP